MGIWELYVKSKGLVFKLFETLNTKEKNAYLDTCNEKGIFEGILLNWAHKGRQFPGAHWKWDRQKWIGKNPCNGFPKQ